MGNSFNGNSQGNGGAIPPSSSTALPAAGWTPTNTFTHQQVLPAQPIPVPVVPTPPPLSVASTPPPIAASIPIAPAVSTQSAANVSGLLHPAAAIFLMLITLNFYLPFWLSRTYKRINAIDPKATTITAGQAWSFLFIPFFGAFWFIRIIFNLPRTVARIAAAPDAPLGAAPIIASIMCLLGSCWAFAIALQTPWMIFLGIVAFEALILGFIGYCQQGLNSAQLKSPGVTASSGAGLLTAAGGFALICAVVLLVAASIPPSDATLQMQRARQSLDSGDFQSAATALERIDQPEAKFQLACLYNSGLGVQMDPVKAVSLMTEAANANLPQAETTLGLWYANGHWVEENPAMAVDWYRKALPKDPNAAVLLSLAYAGGNGVEQNTMEAYKWMLVADKRGNELAASQKSLFGNALEEDQRASAESEAENEYENEIGGSHE
jgi:hypothetical protein